jgi:hypothetical protein
MIYLTIPKKLVQQAPNKTLQLKVRVMSFVGEKNKMYHGHPNKYYTYALQILEYVNPHNENWTDIECSFDAPLDLHNIIKDAIGQAALIEVRLLKNTRDILYWKFSKVLVDIPKTEPTINEGEHDGQLPATDRQTDATSEVSACGDTSPGKIVEAKPATPAASPVEKEIARKWYTKQVMELYSAFHKKLNSEYDAATKREEMIYLNNDIADMIGDDKFKILDDDDKMKVSQTISDEYQWFKFIIPLWKKFAKENDNA